MTFRFLASIIFLCISSFAIAQTSAGPEQSPTGTVRRFWAAETTGERLTTDGWYQTSRFFVRMDPIAPAKMVIHVIRNGVSDKVEETARTQNWAEILVTTSSVGSIDSALRFDPQPKQGAYGVLLLPSNGITFHLVLSDEQWKVNHDGGREEGVKGSQQWLIDCEQKDIWIDREVAIRYVTEKRDKTSDPVVRKNADKTIAALGSYR